VNETLLALAALVLALIALSRTGKGGDLALRVKHLEEELVRLRALLARGGGAPAAGSEPPELERVRDDVAAPDPAPDPMLVDVPAGAAAEPNPPWRTEAAATRATSVPPDAGPSPDAPATAEGDLVADGAGTIVRPPSLPPEPPPPSLFEQVDWEQWLGVRGAAVLGGAALALAGLFFFRYSIEHGLIPPWLRVVMGVLAGVAAIGGAEWSLRRDYAGTANALAGGGLVILYAAFWAAGQLYGLIPIGAVFVLMVVVTAAGCVLSWRHHSLVIAVIGLVGGFLTPIFASSGSDNPIGLFAYVLLLDAGLLALARRMGWPLLGALALAGTTIYQLLWTFGRMDADRVLLGLAILGVFGLLFVFATPRPADDDSPVWRWSRNAGVMLPLVTALYFAANADLGTSILPLGGLLLVLGLAAGFLARQHREGLIGLAAAAASLGVMVVWVVQNDRLGGAPWTVALVFVALAAAHHVVLELLRDEAPEGDLLFRMLARGATVLGLGLLVVLVVAGGLRSFPLPPLLAGWLGIAALLTRQATLPGRGRGRVQIAAAAGVALGLVCYRLQNDVAEYAPSYAIVLPAMLLVALGWQGVALLQRALASRRQAEHAAATAALVLLLGRLPDAPNDALIGLGIPVVLGLLVLLAATRLGGGPWTLAATLATALVQLGWVMDRRSSGVTTSTLVLMLLIASSALFTLWPLLARQWLREDRWPWRAAAIAGLLWLPATGTVFEDLFGNAAIGVVPLVLGAFSVAAAAGARNLWEADDSRRTSALAWLCGAALSLLTIAIPLQVDKEWITIGWALEGAALLVLWTRLDHPGLKYTALALLLAVTVRLVGNPEVLTYHPRAAWRIVNWLAYAYLVPAAALVFAARTLLPLEVPRLRDWERPFYPREAPVGAGAAGLAALVVVFVWINLAIADWFSPTDELRLFAANTAAEKLTLSIAWALYAVVLLALGVRLTSVSLRWASLVLLLITIGKIFLYDVGELTDLYRVGALLGLALSLIVVSLVYQRFVFRRTRDEETS
jgi:uncharacterized membrane protein